MQQQLERPKAPLAGFVVQLEVGKGARLVFEDQPRELTDGAGNGERDQPGSDSRDELNQGVEGNIEGKIGLEFPVVHV